MAKNIRCSNENCRTEITPTWRKIGTKPYCNACAVYAKRHNGKNRPLSQVQNDNNKLIKKIITINRPRKYMKENTNKRKNYKTTRTNKFTFVFKNTDVKQKNKKNTYERKVEFRKEKEKEKEKGEQEEEEEEEYVNNYKYDNDENEDDSDYNEEEEDDGDDDEEYNYNEDDSDVYQEEESQNENEKEKEPERGNEDEKSEEFFRNYKGSLMLKELLNEQKTCEVNRENQVFNSTYRKRKKKFNKRGTKTKKKPKSCTEPFKSTSYLKKESKPKQSRLGDSNQILKKKSISPFFHKSKSENEMDSNDNRNRSNRIHRIQETNKNFIGHNLNITTRLNNSSSMIFDTNSSFLTTSESSTSFDHDLQEDIFKFSSRTKKRKKLRKRRKKQIVSEMENKSVPFKRNECVAIRSNENQEIFAIIKGFYRSIKSNNIYIKVRWLLPKIHPFHPQWKLLDTKRLQKSDFQMGELEHIYQPISSVTRKLNFRFEDEKIY
ncbi:transcription factor gata-5 [Anaeramoeba flamelloides]|uniref:Transcription factor gata-5 n=1 Tax=Anaeramoeba flamelloides TaxID=1746091 RepID=A0AAV8AFA7_9EUKA|nr:transcription factor gata-5 [Anaeramoeba flamelloides]